MLKIRLPNGNVLIWLETSSEDGIDHILILSGGDVLFLKTAKILPMYKPQVREDIKTLNYNGFLEKYEVTVDSRDFWKELKQGVEEGRYPAFEWWPHKAIDEIHDIICQHISMLSRGKDPDERTRRLEAIIRECRNKITEIQSKQPNYDHQE